MTFDLGPIIRTLSRHKGAVLLVVLEVAFGFMIVSTLFIAGRFYYRVGTSQLGHPHANLLSVVSVAPASDDPRAPMTRLERDRAAISALPGVEAVATTSRDLLDHRWTAPSAFWPLPDDAAHVYDAPPPLASLPPEQAAPAYVVWADPTLPGVLGVKLLHGRLPADLPREEQARSMLISRTLAERLGGVQGAVGRWVLGDERLPVKVSGVFDDIVMTVPYLPNVRALALRTSPAVLTEREHRFVVRTAPGARDAVAAEIEWVLAKTAGGRSLAIQPYDWKVTRYWQISRGIVSYLFFLALELGAVALLGSLAVSSFLVAERTRQIGVRRALGASRADITRYFVVENLLLTSIGILLGVGMTIGFFAATDGVFPGLTIDGRVLAGTAALFVIDGALAALWPASRAARIEPSLATRSL